MTERKALFEDFCRTGYVPIHLQPWWMDAVCTPGAWDVGVVTDGNGVVIGAMPWFQKRRWGLQVIQLPPLTTYGGPWLRYPDDPDFKLQSKYTFEKKVCRQLIEQLPTTAFFLQNFRPEVENWLPFYWAKFRQTTRYTYIFDKTTNVEVAKSSLKSSIRTNLKKAARFVHWRREDDAWQTLFQLNHLSFRRKGLRQPHLESTFYQLHTALYDRKQMACFIARDLLTGSPHAGLYLAYDTERASLLLTGIDPAYKYSCAIDVLIFEAIQWCGARGLSFDFEGSMDPNIEHTFRAFGARQQPYFQIWQARNRFLELLFQLTR